MPEKVKISIDKTVALKINVNPKDLKLKIVRPIKIELNLRRALNGDYLIYDHPIIDIVIMPAKNKVVTFSKKNPKSDPYISQDKFFTYLARKGVIVYDTIQAGNVLGSLEAVYQPSEDIDVIQALLLLVYKFVQEELPLFVGIDIYDEDFEDELLYPDPEHSTELGEVPQKARKGSIDPFMKPYGLIYRI
jgi:hypothetical protein